MSYDLYLEADLGGPEPVGVDALDHWNYTSNVARMWRLAMPQTDGLAGMHGRLAGECAEHLERGITYMERHAPVFRRMNPDNGWGAFDGEHGQLGELKRLLVAFRAAPLARVVVSR